MWHNDWLITSIVAYLSAIGFVGGIFGILAWNEIRKYTQFLEYINKKAGKNAKIK